MYEAVDLGPSPADRRDQIAYYDNGVGTSTFKPLAILSGIFGIGLKRNILQIYRYACRNYRPYPGQQPGVAATKGDFIYAFGFSRGAYTVRMLIALIAEQGLIPYTDESDLLAKSRQAYRAFWSGKPRYGWASPVWWAIWSARKVAHALGRAFALVVHLLVRSLALLAKLWIRYVQPADVHAAAIVDRAKRALKTARPYNKADNYRPAIRFVGVWDTVSAYGGPITELTRAVDNWIYRLSLPNQRLDIHVQTARHALALDDERDAFQPLLWDEVNEEKLIAYRAANPNSLPDWINDNRLEQVWFCGMHSDVGGGYPDESLSYVSLLWMIEEAKEAGLRTIRSITMRYRALGNSFGPMHNSRAGLASYYRYQPRRIDAWLDPADPATRSLRDPQIGDVTGPRGLIKTVKIHESVIARIASGTDRYAPFTLPARFSVHPPGELAENLPEDADSRSMTVREAARRVMVDPDDERRLVDPARTQWAARALGVVWDRVWLRRATYFLTLGATLALLAMPLWISVAPNPPFLTDGRTWVGSLIAITELVAPQFLRPWIQVYEHNAFYFLLFVALILAFGAASNRLELALRDRARHVWRHVLDDPNPNAFAEPPAPKWFERWRSNSTYQRTVQVVKWHVLPSLAGMIMIALAIWALLGLITQLALPTLESRTYLCPAPSSQKRLEVISRDFSVRSACNPMRIRVEAGKRYDVSFYVVDDWTDSDRAATPLGLGIWGYRWGAGFFGVPFKRVMTAAYLQPIVEIRRRSSGGIFPPVFIYPLSLTRDSDDTNLYRGTFIAPRSGNLDLYVNDVVFPLMGDLQYFYQRSGNSTKPGNYGSACVLIARTDAGGDNLVRVSSPICLKAVEQERQLQAAKAHSVNRRPTLLQ